jgi:hypothetical protein
MKWLNEQKVNNCFICGVRCMIWNLDLSNDKYLNICAPCMAKMLGEYIKSMNTVDLTNYILRYKNVKNKE